jgi:hypothetical protein
VLHRSAASADGSAPTPQRGIVCGKDHLDRDLANNPARMLLESVRLGLLTVARAPSVWP